MKTPRAYCTYFDSGYLSRGLALIASLREQGDLSPVYVLALDTIAAEYLVHAGLANVHVLTMQDIELAEPGLLAVKESRSRMEYYFTSTPLLIRYVMNAQSIPNALTIYLDGDLYFFDDPQLVVDDVAESSVGIIEHRYPSKLEKKLAKYGRFNVGWVGFRNDASGRAVLDWYSQKTLEWCHDIPEDGKYADQGYLDWFPQFPGVKILHNAGFNVAPWNMKRHQIREFTRPDGKKHITADGSDLVFFHFHGLRKVRNRYATGELSYGTRLPAMAKQGIYQPYVDELNDLEIRLAAELPPQQNVKSRGTGLHGFLSRARKSILNIVSTAIGNSVRPQESVSN